MKFQEMENAMLEGPDAAFPLSDRQKNERILKTFRSLPFHQRRDDTGMHFGWIEPWPWYGEQKGDTNGKTE